MQGTRIAGNLRTARESSRRQSGDFTVPVRECPYLPSPGDAFGHGRGFRSICILPVTPLRGDRPKATMRGAPQHGKKKESAGGSAGIPDANTGPGTDCGSQFPTGNARPQTCLFPNRAGKRATGAVKPLIPKKPSTFILSAWSQILILPSAFRPVNRRQPDRKPSARRQSNLFLNPHGREASDPRNHRLGLTQSTIISSAWSQRWSPLRAFRPAGRQTRRNPKSIWSSRLAPADEIPAPFCAWDVGEWTEWHC
jgi:hypothetical protein